MRRSVLTILLLFSPVVAMSQAIPQTPGSMPDVLSEMPKRAKLLAKNHKDFRKYAQTINSGCTWLKERMSENDPAEYRLQLTIDDYLLGQALANPAVASGIMKGVAEDVDLKSRDCWKFGHGRRVPIEIRTVKGGVEESGWQVFYHWLPPNNLPVQVVELSFPNPSSPSLWDLPVGMYEIYIEKKDAAGTMQKSNAMVIPVGLEEKAAWRLQIP
ncbi:MAG TPA: hypothetical protein VMO17_17670 [Terriglobia bacterium]|nr:hypothetical protein [Terriglobia bacterium]